MTGGTMWEEGASADHGDGRTVEAAASTAEVDYLTWCSCRRWVG